MDLSSSARAARIFVEHDLGSSGQFAGRLNTKNVAQGKRPKRLCARACVLCVCESECVGIRCVLVSQGGDHWRLEPSLQGPFSCCCRLHDFCSRALQIYAYYPSMSVVCVFFSRFSPLPEVHHLCPVRRCGAICDSGTWKDTCTHARTRDLMGSGHTGYGLAQGCGGRTGRDELGETFHAILHSMWRTHIRNVVVSSFGFHLILLVQYVVSASVIVRPERTGAERSKMTRGDPPLSNEFCRTFFFFSPSMVIHGWQAYARSLPPTPVRLSRRDGGVRPHLLAYMMSS